MMKKIGILIVISLLFFGCGQHVVPKPYGYFRIAIPDTAYTQYAPQGYPYAFSLSDNAVVRPHAHKGDAYWIDIDYPGLNTTIHCSYKPVHGNLRALSRDAQEFLYKHATIATSIPEQGFENPDARMAYAAWICGSISTSGVRAVSNDRKRRASAAGVNCATLPGKSTTGRVV